MKVIRRLPAGFRTRSLSLTVEDPDQFNDRASSPTKEGISPQQVRLSRRATAAFLPNLANGDPMLMRACSLEFGAATPVCLKCGVGLSAEDAALRAGICSACIDAHSPSICQLCKTTLQMEQEHWRKGLCDACFDSCAKPEKHCKLCQTTLHEKQLRWGSGLCDPCYDNVEKVCKVCQNRLELETLHWRTGLCDPCYNSCEKTCRNCQSKISLGQLSWRTGYCDDCYDLCKRACETCKLQLGTSTLQGPEGQNCACQTSQERMTCKMCTCDIPQGQLRWGSGLCDECYNKCEKNCRNCQCKLAFGELHWGSGLCDACYNSFQKTCNLCESKVNLGQWHWGVGLCDQCYDASEKTCFVCRSRLVFGADHWGSGLCNACHSIVKPAAVQPLIRRAHSSDSYFAVEQVAEWVPRNRIFLDKSFALERADAVLSSPAPKEKEVSRLMLVLWCLFGASGWWGCNAISAELPLLVTELPEGVEMGNLIAASTQIGSLCPIVYKMLEMYFNIEVSYVIHFAQAVACVTLIACSTFWNTLVYGRSFPLIVMTAVLGGVGNMTDVTFWSYAMRYPAPCTKALSVGMSLGGLLVAGLATVQVGGSVLLFGVQEFFFVAAALQLAFWSVAFGVEGRLPSIGRRLKKVAYQLWACGRSRCGGSSDCRFMPTVNLDPDFMVSEGSFHSPVQLGVESVGSLNESLLPSVDETGGRHTSKEAPGAKRSSPLDLMSRLSLVRGGDDSCPVARTSRVRKSLLASCFIVYALTYTVPSLLPFIGTAFDSKQAKQQLLLWMLVAQNAGDVLGRLCAPNVGPKDTAVSSGASISGYRIAMMMSVLAMVASFMCMLALARQPFLVPDLMSDKAAAVALPGLVFVFFFARGLLVTALYMLPRNLLQDRAVAAQVASMMGFLGQMGALSANVLAFVAVSLFHSLGRPDAA